MKGNRLESQGAAFISVCVCVEFDSFLISEPERLRVEFISYGLQKNSFLYLSIFIFGNTKVKY